MAHIKPSELRAVINAVQARTKTRGTFFSVETLQRKGGERKFNCHFGYGKYLKGGEAAYDYEEKGLLAIFDQKAWHKFIKGLSHTPIRTINCREIVRLQVSRIVLIENGELTDAYKNMTLS